jgi:hypothetical protein
VIPRGFDVEAARGPRVSHTFLNADRLFCAAHGISGPSVRHLRRRNSETSAWDQTDGYIEHRWTNGPQRPVIRTSATGATYRRPLRRAATPRIRPKRLTTTTAASSLGMAASTKRRAPAAKPVTPAIPTRARTLFQPRELGVGRLVEPGPRRVKRDRHALGNRDFESPGCRSRGLRRIASCIKARRGGGSSR